VTDSPDRGLEHETDGGKPDSYRRSDGIAVIGGEGPDRGALDPWLQATQLIVAADSGLEKVHALGLHADYVVGDMDSLADHRLLETFPPGRVLRFDAEKDETDTEIALGLLAERGARRPLIVGGGGGRLDHLLAILALFDRPRYPAAWLTAHEEAVVVDEHIRLVDMQDEVVSLFPVGQERCTMRSSGLQWPLDDLEWGRGDHGVSNVVVAAVAELRMTSGRLLLVRSTARRPGAR